MPGVKVTVRTARWILSELILRIMSATNIQNSQQKEIINMSVLVALEINVVVKATIFRKQLFSR